MTTEEKNILLHALKSVTIEQAKCSQKISDILDKLYDDLCEKEHNFSSDKI